MIRRRDTAYHSSRQRSQSRAKAQGTFTTFPPHFPERAVGRIGTLGLAATNLRGDHSAVKHHAEAGISRSAARNCACLQRLHDCQAVSPALPTYPQQSTGGCAHRLSTRSAEASFSRGKWRMESATDGLEPTAYSSNPRYNSTSRSAVASHENPAAWAMAPADNRAALSASSRIAASARA